jgi:hypothetical protein
MSGQRGSGDPAPRGGVVGAHAVLASRAQVLADRRALYRLALDLIGWDVEPSAAVLDHPVSRFRIGEVIAGRTSGAGLRLVEPDELAPAPGRGPAVAAGPDSERLLAPALRSVAAEAGLPGALGLITRADDERFDRALAEVVAGLERAGELVPELLGDLVGHVALIGIIDPARSGAVVSASSRHVPGLVLLRPGGPLEVAESIVHEAAHQRLFDLAITRDLLRGDADDRPGFRPSWRSTTWPVEQTLAAFHAYACLAELAASVPPPERATVGPHSVLSEAPDRAVEIGGWLAQHRELLGADAIRLVRALLGHPVAVVDEEPSRPSALPDGPAFHAEECRVVPAADGRCLVGLPAEPPRLFWLDPDAAAVLEVLRVTGPIPAAQIRQRLGERPGSRDTAVRVIDALDTLVMAELAAPGPASRG